MSHKVGSITPSRFIVGVTHASIQSAITAANAAGGGVVQIPCGAYTEDLTLADNVTLEGFGSPFNSILGVLAGTQITGNHTFSVGGGSCVVRNIAFVNTPLAPTLSLSGATIIFSIEDCQFFLDAASGATDSSLVVTASASSLVRVLDSVLYDVTTAFAAVTTPTYLVRVSPAATTCAVDCTQSSIVRSSFSPPLASILAEAGAEITVTRGMVSGKIVLVDTAIFTGQDSQLEVDFTGAAVAAVPVFQTSSADGEVRLSNCSVLAYGASWITGPSQVKLLTPLQSGQGVTSANKPPYSQILPSGFDIVSITKTNPTVVRTNMASGVLVGDRVLILGHSNPLLNRSSIVQAVAGINVTLDANTLDSGSFLPESITSSSVAVTTGTVFVANTVGLNDGEIVQIIKHDVSAFNGAHRISNVVLNTSFDIGVPAGTATPGGAFGYVFRTSIGIPTVHGGTGTTGGVLIKEASGVMKPIKSSVNGTYETYSAHGFLVSDTIMVVDHDSFTGTNWTQTVSNVPDATHFTLTVNAVSGTDKGVAVLVSSRNQTAPIHGPIVLTSVEDTFGVFDTGQYPAGTLYLDQFEPGTLPDIRGMIAPGVSRSLGNRVNVRDDSTTGDVPVVWNDEVIAAHNTGATINYLLPVTQEEGAYVGRVLTIVAKFNPALFNVSVQSAAGKLYWDGTQDITTAQAILSLAFHRSVTLTCISAPKLADIANSASTEGSTWAITARGA